MARRLPTKLILALSLVIVLGHSFLSLDFIPRNTNWGWYLRVILHEPNYDKWPYIGLYPIIPWIGVMGLGWSLGSYLLKIDGSVMTILKKRFASIGIMSLILFVGVRWLNGFGNLLPRKGNSLVAWLYVSKYPPDVAFLLWTLGIMCLIMALGMHLEKLNLLAGKFTSVILVFGRNALFFYLVHLWLYRLLREHMCHHFTLDLEKRFFSGRWDLWYFGSFAYDMRSSNACTLNQSFNSYSGEYEQVEKSRPDIFGWTSFSCNWFRGDDSA